MSSTKEIKTTNANKKVSEPKRNKKSHQESDSDSDDSFISENDSEMDSHEYRKFVSKIFPSKHINKKIKAGEKSWLSGWTYATLLQNVSGLQNCYTDINGDGKTDNVDFLQLLGKFNQNCK